MADKTGAGIFSIFSELSDAAKAVGKIHNAGNKASLSEFLANTIVEPVCLTQESLAHLEVTQDLHMNILESWACMYLQVAARLFAVDIDAVHVTRMLEKLATDRDVMGSLAAVEGEACGLIGAGLEAERKSLGVRDKQFGTVYENNNLSIGKMVQVSASNGNNSIDIPVQIRLRSKIAPDDLVLKIFEANAADLNIFSRVKLATMEEISWSEALTGSDIVAKQEEVRMRDSEGLIRSHFLQSVKEAGYIAATGEVPLNRASGVTIIDTRAQRRIETAVRGRLEKFKYRQKFFDGTAGMVLAIVDEESEVVEIYYRGFKDGQTLTFRQLAREAKKSNSDLTPMVKDMLTGRIPS